MIVGLIADIHGNQHALTAVLDALYNHQVDLILCAGDLVCYGAQPNHVISTLRQAAIPCVAGNYDAAVAWDLPQASRKPSSPSTEPLKQAALDWTKQAIYPRHREYLRGLPCSMNFNLDRLRLHLMHAGPHHLDEWITPDEPKALADLAIALNTDVVVLAHTHQAYTHRVVDERGHTTFFVNPGAVGRSLDGDTRAAYALLDTTRNAATLHRVEYEHAQAVQAIFHSGMPVGIALLIQQGARRLEQLPPATLAQHGIEIP